MTLVVGGQATENTEYGCKCCIEQAKNVQRVIAGAASVIASIQLHDHTLISTLAGLIPFHVVADGEIQRRWEFRISNSHQ